MVQVVREAKPVEITCKTCKANLSYTYDEREEFKDYDYTGAYDLLYKINCPCCGTIIIVP